MQISRQISGMGIVVLAAFFVSWTSILSPAIYAGGSNPLTILLIRFLGFIILAQILLLLRQQSPQLDKVHTLHAFGCGIVYTIGTGSLLYGFLYIPVSLVVLLFYIYPLLTMLLTCLLQHRRPRTTQLLCLFLALAGIYLALEVTLEVANTSYLMGVGFSLLAALSMALSYVWNCRALSTVEPIVATYNMSLSGALVVSILLISMDALHLPVGALGWSALIMATICFSIAFLLMFTAVQRIGPNQTAMTMNMEPVVTIALAIPLLGESLTFSQMTGAIMIIIAVLISQMHATKKPEYAH